jgi:prepilin-type N-terminal cleavage/methylation domain-containing protein
MRRARGFTLVELAVALAVIGLLIGMLMVPLNAQVDQQRINDTRKQLDLVTEAILGFAVANGRLPCPAVATTANTVAGAGAENFAAPSCVGAVAGVVVGVVPWATLGLPEVDAWERRFTYVATDTFADNLPAGMPASFALTDTGNLIVTSGGVTIANGMAAVIVSHGKNGLGGFRTDGVQVGGASGDELENANGNITFVAKIPDTAFDDLVVWVSPNILKSRMVAANRLP